MPVPFNEDGTSTVRLNMHKKPSGGRQMDVIAYRFGGQLAENELYRKDDWSSLEPEARRQWKQKYPETAWFEIRHAVHLGWYYARGARR